MKKATLKGSLSFILTVAVLSFPIGGVFDTATIFLDQVPWYVGALMVFLIVLIGAAFDMIGVAAAAARETPFHAMAAKRVFGARQAIVIVRNAEKVSSLASDVVGDIAGVLSGAGALAVAVQLGHAIHAHGWHNELVIIVLTALVTSVTIGAKAVGKTIAIQSPTPIILFASRVAESLLVVWRKSPQRGERRKKKNKSGK
jgi:CBS domain containing-hemolysin-like protein